MHVLKVAYNAAWGIALVWVLVWGYADASAPPWLHESLVYGLQAAAQAPGQVAWLVVGGLGFWFGLRTMAGRLR
jgi:hypothetical protein